MVTATPGQRRRLLSDFPGLSASRVQVVPDGLDARDAPEPSWTPDAIDATKGRPLRLVVAGHLERGMHGLVDALEVLSSTDPGLGKTLCVHFLDTLDPLLQRQFRRVTVPELYDLDTRVPEAARARALARADALVCIQSRGQGHRVPIEWYAALAARRPILGLLPPGDGWDLLAASGVARLVDNVDAAACAAGLKAFVAELGSGRLAWQPRPEWLQGLDSRRSAAGLAAILAAAAGREVEAERAAGRVGGLPGIERPGQPPRVG